MDKESAVEQNMVVLARRRKKKKSKSAKMRSKMLKMIMPMLSRENGEKLGEAIAERNIDNFRRVWRSIQDQIAEKLESSKEARASASDEDEYEESLFESLSKTDPGRVFIGNSLIPDLVRELGSTGIATVHGNGTEGELRIASIKIKNVGKPGEMPMMDMICFFEGETIKVQNKALGDCLKLSIIQAIAALHG